MEENRNYELCKVFKVDRDLQEIFSDSLLKMGFNHYGDREIENEYLTEFENDVFMLKSFSYDSSDCNCGFEDKCYEIDEDCNSEFMGFHDVHCNCNSAPNFWYKPMNLKISWYKYPFRDAYSNYEIDKTMLERIILHCENSFNKTSIKEEKFNSEILNNDIISQYYNPFKMVYFENENDIEKYEQVNCEGDNNTWNSWRSIKDKITFPCWLCVKYQKHPHDGSYTAIYLTKDEAIKDFKKCIDKIKKLD